ILVVILFSSGVRGDHIVSSRNNVVARRDHIVVLGDYAAAIADARNRLANRLGCSLDQLLVHISVDAVDAYA
ncbi:hypothetical protein NYZ28_19470, partial [Acinetobacter baumannii]|nr:hypothetical protein [Acinetobacter baumannii]